MTTDAKRRTKTTERPRGRGVRQLRDLLPDVGGPSFRRFGFVQSSVVSRWGEIVGDRYAAVSTPESIRFAPGRRDEGVLTLSVEGAHAPMLQHVTPAIIERVNRFFGYTAVARVTIRRGEVRRREARVAPPSLRPVPAELGESLRTIADPELRACLEGLASALGGSAPMPLTTIPLAGKVRA